MAEATVKQVPPQPPPETRVVLDLSEEEAFMVAAALGGLSRPPAALGQVYYALAGAGYGQFTRGLAEGERSPRYNDARSQLRERGSTLR